MSDTLRNQVEVRKLARVLGSTPDRFRYLSDVDPEQLRLLRGQMTDVLFDANLDVLQRMATASRLLPAPLLAKIAERTFGPLLCARLAGLIEVSRGVDVAKRLSPRFLADVAVELDPRRASAIIAGIHGPPVTAVTAELARRRDWITIGRFVGHVPDRTVETSLGAIGDAALLEVAFVLEDKSRLDHVVGLLPERRLDGVLRAAVEQELWPELLDLLTHLREPRSTRLAELAATLDEETRAEALDLAKELGVLNLLGPFRAALGG